MSVYWITGEPGAGKSHYLIERWFLPTLLQTDKVIITNVEVHKDRLADYLHSRTDKDVDVLNRLLMIDEEMSQRFYLHRPEGYVADDPRVQEEQDKRTGQIKDLYYQKPRINYGELKVWKGEGDEPTKSINDLPPVLYAIDEVHEHFPAREWAQTGRFVISYLSQHRKLGDDVILISQYMSQVDKALRNYGQDYAFLRNHKKERLGVFRSLPFTTVGHYLEPPVSKQVKSIWTETMTIKPKTIGTFYDTAAGVGIHGAKADTDSKPKGLPLSIAIGLVIAGICGLAFVPRAIMGSIRGKAPVIESSEATPSAPIGEARQDQAGPDASPAPSGNFGEKVEAAATIAKKIEVPESASWNLIGIIASGRQAKAIFQEGMTVTSRTGRLKLWGQNWAIVDGIYHEVGEGGPVQPARPERASSDASHNRLPSLPTPRILPGAYNRQVVINAGGENG